MLTTKIVEEKTVMDLTEIYDPELPVTISELGVRYFVVGEEALRNEPEFFVTV